MMSRLGSLFVAVSLGAILASGAAVGETMKFKADLKAASEVPPTDSAGTGLADVSVDTSTKKLTWTITSSGLTGEATAAHFHGPAAVGENAGPVVDISKNVASGTSDITDAQLSYLHAGKWYLNIHTQKYPDGEIRGQVEKAQ